MTQDSNAQVSASTSDANEGLTPCKTIPPPPVTTQDSNAHATPSAADRRLYNASRDGDLERVKQILSAGHVDINSRVVYSWTPVLVGHVNINKRRARRSRTPMMATVMSGHRDVVEFLVGRGADASLVDDFRNNVLHWACMGGHLEIVKLILSLNVVDINSRGWHSRTPVMMVARRGHSDVVKFLVGRGAEVSLVDEFGNDALHFACIGGDMETVKLILSLNVVDVNARNNEGRTAADYARNWRRHRVVELLVSRGPH